MLQTVILSHLSGMHFGATPDASVTSELKYPKSEVCRVPYPVRRSLNLFHSKPNWKLCKMQMTFMSLPTVYSFNMPPLKRAAFNETLCLKLLASSLYQRNKFSFTSKCETVNFAVSLMSNCFRGCGCGAIKNKGVHAPQLLKCG